jgi:hypothetical protein
VKAAPAGFDFAQNCSPDRPVNVHPWAVPEIIPAEFVISFHSSHVTQGLLCQSFTANPWTNNRYNP